MKNIFLNFIIAIVALGFLTGCEESIETTQPDVLTVDASLAKIATYEQLVNSAYDRAQSFAYLAQYQMLAPDALADNAILVNNTGRYVGELNNQNQAHFNLWFLYPAINDCNIIIDRIDTVQSVANRTRVRIAEAQARFLRAMIMFDMVRVYGYEPGKEVEDWNLGIILRDKPTFDVASADLRARSTTEEVYEFIEADLLRAIDSLAVPSTSVGNFPFRASLPAAHALLGKVYLYWGRNADAITSFDNAIATKPAAVDVVSAANYVGMWSTAATSGRTESLFELRIFVGSTGTNGDWSTVDGVNESLHSLTTTGITQSSQFVLAGSPSLMASFEPGDVRRNLWTNTLVRGLDYNMCLKWPGSAGAGFWADNIPVIRMSDVYLMRAEAFYKLNQEDNARTALNYVRTRRGLPAVTNVNATGTALFDVIMNERRVEFAFEGSRFFDFKRNGLDIPKNDGSVLQYTDFRILAPLPLAQITLNPNLRQNPGY